MPPQTVRTARQAPESHEEVAVNVEDSLTRIMRFLNTPISQLTRRGNSLSITVRAELAEKLQIREGSRFYILSGINYEELEDAVSLIRSMTRSSWILLLHRVEE